MSSNFKFVVEVSLNRTQGKFAPRDDLGEEIRQAIDDANPGSINAGDDGEYDVESWDVSEEEIKPPKKGPTDAQRLTEIAEIIRNNDIQGSDLKQSDINRILALADGKPVRPRKLPTPRRDNASGPNNDED